MEGYVQTLDDEAVNVTEIKAYKNKELAKMKSLEELEERIKKELEEKQMKEGIESTNPVR